MDRNRGLDLGREAQERSVEDWIFGAKPLSGIAEGIDFNKFFPKGEVQRGLEDFMDCVTRGFLNVLEVKFTYAVQNEIFHKDDITWLKEKGYSDDEGNVTFSDRFNAVLSNTTRNGNSLKAPAESVRKDGLIPKKLLPKEANMTWAQYHDRSKITQPLRELGKAFLERFTVNYDVVPIDSFKDALGRDLIVSGVYAWPNPINGVYPRVEYTLNHVVMFFGTKIYHIFDNYEESPGDFIKNLAPNYKILQYGYRVVVNPIKKKDNENLEINEEKNMIFYKTADSPRVYQLGADGLYHHVVDQPVFEGLYGEIGKAEIQTVIISPEQIGFTIYDKRSFVNLLLSVLSFFKGK